MGAEEVVNRPYSTLAFLPLYGPVELRLIRLAKAALPVGLHKPLRPIGRAWRQLNIWRLALGASLRTLRGTRRHSLPALLVLSLTSHSPRFPYIHNTLKSLLRQTVRPDHVVLWVAHDDLPFLPPKVTALVEQGLEIRATPDLGSYKKLIPALRQFPGAFIATADDDVIYDPDWLRELTQEFDPARPSIMCHRAHRARVMQDNSFAPYREWERDVQDEQARKPCTDIIPTGCGGVLYYPNSLHPAVLEEAMFRSICPTTDDFWFYWMARRAGSTYRKIGGPFRYVEVPGSQGCALHLGNEEAAYDGQVAALVKHLGIPGSPDSSHGDKLTNSTR